MKILSREERCQEMVNGTGPWGTFHQHQCEKRFTVIRDSKRYCKVHDPEYIKAKSDVATRKWEEENTRRRASHNLTINAGMLLQAYKDALEASHNPIVEKILMEAIAKVEKTK